MRKKRIFYGILTTAFIMSVLSLSLSGCSEKSAYKEKAENKISVAAYKTEYTSMPDFLKSPGNTDSLNNTVISAHIMG